MVRRLHPILFAAYPVLSLFAANTGTVPPPALSRPLLVAFLALSVCWLLAWALLRTLRSSAAAARSALLSSLVLLPLLGLQRALASFGLAEGSYRWATVTVWFLVLGLAGWIARRPRPNTVLKLESLFAAVAVGLLLVPAANTLHSVASWSPSKQGLRAAAGASTPVLAPHLPPNRPSIFFLICDGYARQDILRDLYGYDNQPFLEALHRRGFRVATRARANYAQTLLSLRATLDMGHLQPLIESLGRERISRAHLGYRVQHGLAFDIARHFGYRIVAFDSGYPPTSLDTADLLLAYPRPFFAEGRDPFFDHFLSWTPLLQLWRYFDDPYRHHAEQQIAILRTLPELAAEPVPLFVFVHLLMPHPPFVYRADGQFDPPTEPFALYDGDHGWRFRYGGHRPAHYEEQYRERYREQLAWLNGQLIATIDGILARSVQTPVIILQSDHGPGSELRWEEPQRSNLEERMSVLNAVLLPGGPPDGWREDLTLINTFPLVYRSMWNLPLEDRPDRSFFSTFRHPFDLIEVPGGGPSHRTARRPLPRANFPSTPQSQPSPTVRRR